MTIYHTDDETPACLALPTVTSRYTPDKPTLAPTMTTHIIGSTVDLPRGGLWVCMDLGEFARSKIEILEVWLMEGKLGWLAWFPYPDDEDDAAHGDL